MARRKSPLPPLEHLPDGSLRRGALGIEKGEPPIDASLSARSVERFIAWKEVALQVLKDAGLPVEPEDNLAARLRREKKPFAEMREPLEPLTEASAAAELVDAVNDVLGDIARQSAILPINAEKLCGAYHQFLMLRTGTNEDAAFGEKTATDLDAGPREVKRKADERVALAVAILGPLLDYWRDPGASTTVKAKQDALRKALLEKGLIKDPNQVNRYNLANWREAALAKRLIK